MQYHILKVAAKPELGAGWSDVPWQSAPSLCVDRFFPRSSAHRPSVQAKMIHYPEGVVGFFAVEDRYVLASQTEPQSTVCQDSCVEFFVEPKAGCGYFNFEFSCGGVMLVHHNRPIVRDGKVDPRTTVLPLKALETIEVYHSMPRHVEPELTEPTTWQLQFAIPFALFEPFIGPLANPPGTVWRANFYKCADATSHPHWASWSPVASGASFHQPEYFAELHFDL